MDCSECRNEDEMQGVEAPCVMSLISSQRSIGQAQRLQRFENASADFARFGMAVDLLLGKDQLIIDPDVKDAAGAGDHVPAFDKNFNFALLENVVRQTDGNGCVVSSRAVFNLDVHQSLLHDCLSLTIFAMFISITYSSIKCKFVFAYSISQKR